MDFLIILDVGPVTNERTENALQFALAMTRRDEVNVRVFVMGDAVAAAKADHPGTADGVDGATRTLRSLVMSGVEVAVCDASLAVRHISSDELMVGATVSPMSLLADWALTSDRALTF